MFFSFFFLLIYVFISFPLFIYVFLLFLLSIYIFLSFLQTNGVDDSARSNPLSYNRLLYTVRHFSLCQFEMKLKYFRPSLEIFFRSIVFCFYFFFQVHFYFLIFNFFVFIRLSWFFFWFFFFLPIISYLELQSWICSNGRRNCWRIIGRLHTDPGTRAGWIIWIVKILILFFENS